MVSVILHPPSPPDFIREAVGTAAGTNSQTTTPVICSEETPEEDTVEAECHTRRPDKGKGKARADEVTAPIEMTPPTDEGDAATSAVDTDNEDSEPEVDWTRYDPPEALSQYPAGTPDLIVELCKSSIQNVRNQIIEEEEARRLADEKERKRKAKEEAEKMDGEAATKSPEPTQHEEATAPTVEVRQPEEAIVPTVEVSAPKKSGLEFQIRLRPFARLLRRVQFPEKGETSAAGAKKYKGHSSASTSTTDLTGPSELLAMLKKEKGREKATSASTAADEQDETVECISCYDDIPVKDTIKTPCHSYCHDCFSRLIFTALENEAQWPPKCCLNEIPAKTVTKHISKELLKTYNSKAAEFRVRIEDRLYCHFPNCGVFVPRSSISLISRVAKCQNGHQTCTICRQAAHGRESCPQDTGLRLTEELATEEGWRRCLRCGVLVEHQDACQHMTCRCGAEFCYVCGRAWRTCSCTMEQLRALKERAAHRRAARTQQEEAEARELAEALEAVAEFEREEARKAALLEAEQERLRVESARAEALRRARARRDRRRREALRRETLAARYAHLRTTLANLRARQAHALQRAHEDAAAHTSAHAVVASADLAAKHAADRAAAAAAAAETIRAAEAVWAADFRARVALERALEQAYAGQLDLLWRGRKDGPARRAAALRAYQGGNDARLDEWERWRAAELGAVRFAAGEEQGIREELMAREGVLRAEWFRERRREGRRRGEAEGRWVEVVCAERARLLDEMEELEREMGGEEVEEELDGEFDSFPGSEGGNGTEFGMEEEALWGDEALDRPAMVGIGSTMGWDFGGMSRRKDRACSRR